ncbi:unnamed protein product [Caenorhabditis brenneri]
MFHIFVTDMSYLNSGNPSIILSILRNFSSDWEQFYKNVDSYLDEFYEHLDNSDDVKITIEKGSEKDTYAMKIELKRPTEEESQEFRRATYMEVPGPLKKWNSERVLRKAENSKPTLKIPVAIPFIFLNSKFLIEIFNYCLFGKKNFDQVLSLRKFLTTQLSGTCLALDPNQFLIIFNQCLKFDLPCLRSDGEPLELDIKFEIDKQEYYVSVLDDDFLKTLKKPEEPIEVSGQGSDDEQLTSLKNNYDEEMAASAKTEAPVFFNESLYNEEIREERRKNRMTHDAEMKDLRRQQKQRFAALMNCIFLKQRFEEKESDWSSWIENSLRQLIVKVVRKFADFQDMTKSFSNFRKLLREDPEDVISEIRDLYRAILTLLYDLETVFNKLAKVDQDFDSVLFVRVIQKRICQVSVILIDLLHLLEEMDYSSTWYQQLVEKMKEVSPSKIPSVSELKRLCKNLNEGDYENLEFPKCENKSIVIIEEVDEEDDEQVGTKTVKSNGDEHRDELQEEVTEDDNCQIFKGVDEKDNEHVSTETAESNGNGHPDKSKDGPSEDDKYGHQVHSLMLNEEVQEETDTAKNENESLPESGEYHPKSFDEPRNDTDTLEICERLFHSSKLGISKLGADYTGDEVTRPNEEYTFGPETSFTKSLRISSFSPNLKFLNYSETSTRNSFALPDRATGTLTDGHDEDKLNFENKEFSTNHEGSKFSESISQNKQPIGVPPRCGPVSPKLDDSLKSESGNPCDDVSTALLEKHKQVLPDEPVSSRTRSVSRSGAVRNSIDDIRRRNEQQLYGAYRNYRMYVDSGPMHRLNFVDTDIGFTFEDAENDSLYNDSTSTDNAPSTSDRVSNSDRKPLIQQDSIAFRTRAASDRESSLRNPTQQLQEQEDQIKLREDKLRKRENELDKKMDEIKSMEVHLDKRVAEIRLTEENLERKMEEMMEMMKLVIGSTATQITGQVRDNTTDTNIIESSVTQFEPTDDVIQAQIQTTPVDELTEDEELRQMEEQFQRAKAEQVRKNELELRNAQERRREMNERAAEERRRISENLARAASFRNSFDS